MSSSNSDINIASSSSSWLLSVIPLVPSTAMFVTIVIGIGLYHFIMTQQQQEQRQRQQACRSDESLLDALVTRQDDESGKEEEKNDCIYLDYNGTTPIHSFVVMAMLPYLTRHFGNPSSSHYYGMAPKRAMEEARQDILKLVLAPNVMDQDCRVQQQQDSSSSSSSLWFTGCGTEADNLAIHLALLQHQQHQEEEEKNKKKQKKTKIPHIVTSNVEHPAITNCLQQLQARGCIDVTYVPVDTDGRVSPENVYRAIRPDETILLSLMLANNESGALFALDEIFAHVATHYPHILRHTDAAQACGKINVPLYTRHADMISIVGHKLGAPKGIAALYVKPGRIALNHKNKKGGILLVGGGQEFGTRGGTENVAYMVGMGKAAQWARQNLNENQAHMEAMRSRLLKRLQDELPVQRIRPNGPVGPNHRLPNTLSVGIWGISSGDLLRKVKDQVAASAGAACHSGGDSISSVLQAMKVPLEYARGTLRLSVGPTTKPEEVDRAASILARQIKQQWKLPK